MMKKSLVVLFLFLFAAICISPSMAKDVTITCKDCQETFVFTDQEKEYYRGKGFENNPSRCPDCRKARKGNRPGRQIQGYGGGGRSFDGNRW